MNPIKKTFSLRNIFIQTLVMITAVSSSFSCNCSNHPKLDNPTPKKDQTHYTALIKNHGIPNIGNTCYMNATLQVLFSLYKKQLMEMPSSDLAKSARALLEAVTSPPSSTETDTERNEKMSK